MQSLDLYDYRGKEEGTYGQEYGVFMVFTLLMGLYCLFAWPLLLFHSYLLAFNVTTHEMLKGSQLWYLQG